MENSGPNGYILAKTQATENSQVLRLSLLTVYALSHNCKKRVKKLAQCYVYCIGSYDGIILHPKTVM